MKFSYTDLAKTYNTLPLGCTLCGAYPDDEHNTKDHKYKEGPLRWGITDEDGYEYGAYHLLEQAEAFIRNMNHVTSLSRLIQ